MLGTKTDLIAFNCLVFKKEQDQKHTIAFIVTM